MKIYLVRGGGATGICEEGAHMWELMQDMVARGFIPTYTLIEVR